MEGRGVLFFFFFFTSPLDLPRSIAEEDEETEHEFCGGGGWSNGEESEEGVDEIRRRGHCDEEVTKLRERLWWWRWREGGDVSGWRDGESDEIDQEVQRRVQKFEVGILFSRPGVMKRGEVKEM